MDLVQRIVRGTRIRAVPAGTSRMIPPVDSRRQACAKAATSARCAGDRPPRALPMNSSTVRSPSLMAIGWRWR